MGKDSRYPRKIRVKQEFYLFKNKAEDRMLIHFCDDLRTMRQFLPTVRQALLLIMDLRNGKVDKLLEYFPDVPKAFEPDFSSLQNEFDRLAKLIETRSFETTSANATSLSEVNTAGLGFKSYTPPLASLSLDDDLSLEVSKAESNSNSAQNLMDSLFGL